MIVRPSTLIPLLFTLVLIGGSLGRATPALAQGADAPPTLSVTSPAAGVLALPDVRVTAQCADDRPGCTITVGTTSGARLASGTDSIDTIVRPPDGDVTLTIAATDAAGQITTVERPMFVHANPRLIPAATLPGRIVDINATRALVWDDQSSPRVLRLFDRTTNTSRIIWTPSDPLTGVSSGFLTPMGAIFEHGQLAQGSALREWRDDTLHNLGSVYLGTLQVEGAWAAFTRIPFPCCADYAVTVRNLTTGAESPVFDTYWAGYYDLVPDGRVIYSTNYSSSPRFEVMAFTPGTPGFHTQLTDTPRGSIDPRSDGVNVVFARAPDQGNNGLEAPPWSIVMTTGGGTEIVLAEGLYINVNYRTAGGWVAFTRWDANKDNLHTWVRAPDGTERQISSLRRGHTTIEALHENGDVIYRAQSLDRAPWLVRYLARADGTSIDLGIPMGEPIWIGNGWYLKAGAHLLAIATDAFPARSILSEGATGTFFTTDVAILNPEPVPVSATIRYLRENAPEIQETRTLAARSRTTIRLNDIPDLANTGVSTVVETTDGSTLAVERLMSWDASAYGGHLGTAVPRPRPRWLFAEGAQGFFNTYFLLANSGAEAASVRLTFLLEQGPPMTQTISVPAGTRRTLYAGDLPALADRSFATVIEADQPIVAERAMYFSDSRLWAGGHGSAGAAAPAEEWFFAEGATGGFFDTFILLANPHAEPVDVSLDYRAEGGGGSFDRKTLPPFSRMTVNLEENPWLPGAAVSIHVNAERLPIVAERAMYWGGPDGWRETHNSFGVTESGLRWGVAEGRLGGDRAYQTYILLSNDEISPIPAALRVTFVREDGMQIERTYSLPRGRLTISAGEIPELADARFSTIVESTNDIRISVESAIYWNAGGVLWEGGGNTVATRLP
jgi:hypothetical protein